MVGSFLFLQFLFKGSNLVDSTIIVPKEKVPNDEFISHDNFVA